MKTNTLMEYTAPALEVISTVVESGFQASFGYEHKQYRGSQRVR